MGSSFKGTQKKYIYIFFKGGRGYKSFFRAVVSNSGPGQSTYGYLKCKRKNNWGQLFRGKSQHIQ